MKELASGTHAATTWTIKLRLELVKAFYLIIKMGTCPCTVEQAQTGAHLEKSGK